MKNTTDIKNILENTIIPDNYSLISFDVKKLFTSIPQNYALNACETALDNYDELFSLTCLDKPELMKLTKLCLESCTFQWNYKFFKQTKGCPMGSPISVALAEFSIQHFENEFLENAPCRPLFWKRYVDDIITALPNDQINNFLQFLNSQNEDFQRISLQTKVNNELMILKRTSLISEEEYKFLRSTTSSIPRFYPLIKTHKINNPIRPIISFIDSPTYKLAKFLSRIFLPITSKSDIKLKNTTDIKNILENTIIPDNYSLVSFDVKKLFTSIPQNYALNACETALDNYDELFSLTCLDKPELMKLTKLCLESCTFQWNYKFFKQTKGCPM